MIKSFPLLVLTAFLTILISPLTAQEAGTPDTETTDPGGFYGFWEFKEPAGDTCIVIIKRGGRLSCFWSGTRSQQIEKGSWERAGTQLIAKWEAGHVDVFEMLGENAINRKSYEPGSSLLEEPALELRGVRIDSRLPGSLTVEREGDSSEPRSVEPSPEPATNPLTMRNPFVGYWKVDQSSGLFGIGGGEPHYFLRISRGGDASVALRDWEGDQAVRGQWSMNGERLVIRWPNNRKDVLYAQGNGPFLLASFKPKREITQKPNELADAERVPASEAERYFEAGDFDRLTVTDIRGTWRPATATPEREYIALEGWGKAYRYPAAAGGDGTDPGTWRLIDDQVIMTWVDGSKDVLRLSFPHFILESFPKTEPLTGTPSRSIKVVRDQSTP